MVLGAAAAIWFLEPGWSPLNTAQFGQGGEVASGSGPVVSSEAAEPAASGAAVEAEVALEASASSTAANDMLTTMTLVGGDISLSYPKDYGLAVNQDQLLVTSYVPVCDQGFEYCLYLRSDEFDGSNFDGAGMRIDVRDDLAFESDCMLEQPSGFSDLVPRVAGSGDHARTRFGQVGQGAAGHLSNGSVYRLYFGNTCYEFETRISQTQFGNYPAGEVERFTDEDAALVRGDFAAILASVSLPDGREALWSTGPGLEVAEPQEADEVLTFTPEPGAVVTSPLQLTGEAVGPWFFEGSFPYRLQTRDGDVLASGVVNAEGDWLTTELVEFEATIEFDVEGRVAGSLVLMKDNPSGLPANDDSVSIPLTMQP